MTIFGCLFHHLMPKISGPTKATDNDEGILNANCLKISLPSDYTK